MIPLSSRLHPCYQRNLPIFDGVAFCRFFGLQLVAQRSIIAPLEAAFCALPFACFNQMFQTTRTDARRLSTFRAALVTLHSQFVLDAMSHIRASLGIS